MKLVLLLHLLEYARVHLVVNVIVIIYLDFQHNQKSRDKQIKAELLYLVIKSCVSWVIISIHCFRFVHFMSSLSL